MLNARIEEQREKLKSKTQSPRIMFATRLNNISPNPEVQLQVPPLQTQDEDGISGYLKRRKKTHEVLLRSERDGAELSK